MLLGGEQKVPRGQDCGLALSQSGTRGYWGAQFLFCFSWFFSCVLIHVWFGRVCDARFGRRWSPQHTCDYWRTIALWFPLPASAIAVWQAPVVLCLSVSGSGFAWLQRYCCCFMQFKSFPPNTKYPRLNNEHGDLFLLLGGIYYSGPRRQNFYYYLNSFVNFI